MMEVAAGIIRREDGRVLICRRGHGQHIHLWEFPGGKIEAGESAARCLSRELWEELRLPVTGLKEAYVRETEGIRFFFLEGETAAEPVLTEHEDSAFVRPREMLRYAFCPADTWVARQLALSDPPLRHFFWDFDGTVMDTYPATVAAFVRGAKSLGLTLDAERVLTLMKDSIPVCIREIERETGITDPVLSAAFQAGEKLIRPEETRPIAGVPDALETLKGQGGHHYLVTHRDRGALIYLKHAGLDELFDDVVSAEDGFPRKPAPDMLLHLVHKHRLRLEECVMIGDRPLDTAAGRNAGMLSCLLDEEGRFPDDPCELRVKRGAELPEALGFVKDEG